MKKIVVVSNTKALLPHLDLGKENDEAGIIAPGQLEVNDRLLSLLLDRFGSKIIRDEYSLSWVDRIRSRFSDEYLVIHARANSHPRPNMYGCEIVVDDESGGSLITMASSIGIKLEKIFRMRGGAKTRITGIKLNSESFAEKFKKLVPKNQRTILINLYYSTNKKDVERYRANKIPITDILFDAIQVWLFY